MIYMRISSRQLIAIVTLSVATSIGVYGDTIDALVDTIEASRQQYDVAAVGLAVVRGKQVLYVGGLGVLDRATKTPADADTQFRVGSITKSFTGLTALRLARGHPDLLTTPANQVINNVIAQASADSPVTLENLLEHTAGLTDLSRAEFDFQGEHVTFAEAIEISPETRVLQWPANRHSSYSNAGYGVAGYMLETIFEKPFETLVHEQVLAPLRMNASGFYPVENGPVMATGYDSDGVTRLPYWHMLYRSFGGLNSTPRDMAQWLSAVIASGDPDTDFLTPAERRRFENPQTTLAARAGLEYGYGLGNYHWFRKGLLFHGHGGDADGYLSHYAYNHDTGMGYFLVITAFRHKPLRAMRNHLEDFIIQQAHTPATHSATLEPAQLKQWVGSYEPVTWRFGGPRKGASVLEINLRDGQLETSYDGTRHALIAVSTRHFRRRWQPDATYAFSVDGNDTFLQGDLGNFKKVGTRRR